MRLRKISAKRARLPEKEKKKKAIPEKNKK